MNLLLQNKIIFLTGGSCGIGRDCAKAYVVEGARVVIAARDKEGVEQTTADLGDGHLGIVCDVSQDADVKNAIEKALSHYGRLDAIHNNAGIVTPSKPIHETTDANLRTTVVEPVALAWLVPTRLNSMSRLSSKPLSIS